jgi:hypothetical protein
MKTLLKKSDPEQRSETIPDERPSYDVQRATRQPLWTLQGKLKVSEPGDKYEKEAERVADAVMRMSDPESTVGTQEKALPNRIQRMCPRPQHSYWHGKPLNCQECEGKPNDHADGEEASIGGSVEHAATVVSEPGRPLSDGVRSFFEHRMGQNFGNVRIHTGVKADLAAKCINARAFTLGGDVVFRIGEYRPDMQTGKQLLAHELTHVVQQECDGERSNWRVQRQDTGITPKGRTRQEIKRESEKKTIKKGMGESTGTAEHQAVSEEKKRIEVKVVTFNQGGFDPPTLEPFRFWPRGHTAVIIDGDVYSFEAGWQCGETEAEYKQDNEWRGAWIQVLDVPKSDARQLQEDFDRSCGRGIFVLTGVCTSNTARLLQNVLAELKITWAPMRLRRQLAKSGHVKRTYRWHRKAWMENLIKCIRGKEGYRPAGLPSKEDIKEARDECFAQMGLREKDAPLPLEFLVEEIRSGHPHENIPNPE